MSSAFNAYHLPGIEPADYVEFQARDLTIRVPRLSPADLQTVIAFVRDARTRLLTTKLDQIVDAIDTAAATFGNPDSELRADALRMLPAATGYSPQMCEYVLDRMSADWRRDPLNSLLAAELGSTDILDRFVEEPHAKRCVTAHGPDTCLHIFSGNVPGVAVTSLIRALLVRSASIGKTARGEPVLPALFAHALRAVAPAIADTIAITYWPAEESALLETAAAESDVIVVYGGDEAVRAVRRAAPPNTRVVVHGPRMSIGFVARDALQDPAYARRCAASIALATATFDQQGCVSPHTVFVQLGGSVSPRQLAAFVAEELEQLERSLPRARLSPEEAAAVRNAKTRAEFAAYAGAETEVMPIQDRPFAVIYDARPGFEPSCLNRVLYVRTFIDVHDIARILKPHRTSLQSAALAGFADNDLAAAASSLAASGITRITSFDRLPFPPPAWHHDGSPPLRELIRYIDWE